jgi:hypothetical protein
MVIIFWTRVRLASHSCTIHTSQFLPKAPKVPYLPANRSVTAGRSYGVYGFHWYPSFSREKLGKRPRGRVPKGDEPPISPSDVRSNSHPSIHGSNLPSPTDTSSPWSQPPLSRRGISYRNRGYHVQQSGPYVPRWDLGTLDLEM